MGRRYREYSLTKRQNGLWQAAFMKDGKRHYVYDRDRERVLEKIAEAKAAVSSPPSSILVSDLLNGWIKAVTPTLGPQTLVSYVNIVTRHLVPGFSGIVLDALDETDIEDYIEKKLASGLSPRTVQYHHRLLSLALSRAEARGQVAANVARRVKAPAPRPPEIHPLTKTEVAKLLDGTSGQDHNLYAVAIFTGLRLGEIVGLRWRSVDLAAGTLTVDQAVGRIAQRNAILPPKSKTSRRTIPLPRQALDALKDQKRAATSKELVFANDEGGLLIGTTIGSRFEWHLKRLGIPKRRFHDLRHTCATLMLGAGGNLDDVKRFLGHSSIKLTSDTYGHLDPVRQREVADLLSNAI